MTSDPPPLERRRVVVHGRVQGVWFRESCRREAVARNVAGWVRNRADGTVEAVFEGPPQAVAAMVAWCRIGPPRAEVARLEVTAEPVGGEVGYSVR
jgi:acylphosphatase